MVKKNKIQKNSKFIIYMIICILIFLNIFLAVKLRRRSIEHLKCSEALFTAEKILNIGFSKIPELTMRTSDNEEMMILKNSRPLTILVFIKTTDCPPCLEKLKNLNIAMTKKSVPVLGVSFVNDKSYYIDLKQAYKLSFPFLIDNDRILFKSLSPNISTPLVLYLNSNLDIVDFDLGSNIINQEYVIDKIENLL